VNTFTAPFAFDDGYSIVDNPIVKDLGNFTSSLSGYHYNPRRYIGYLTFALNYRFGGLEVTGYHEVNLLIHILNAILVYFFVVLTFRTPFFSCQLSAISYQQSPGRSKKSVVSSDDSTTRQLDFSPSRFTFHDSRVVGDSRFTIHHSQFIALFSALLFVVHPVQTQAVTYIVQRFTSLVTMFYLLAVVMYIKGRLTTQSAESKAQSDQQSARSKKSVVSGEQPSSSQVVEGSSNDSTTQQLNFSPSRSMFSVVFYLLSLIFAVLAMKTKEIAFTLPIMILLYEFTFFRSSLKKKLLFLIPVLLTLVIIPLSMMHVDKPLGEVLSDLSEQSRVQTGISRGDYLLTEMRVIVTYLRLIFLPVNQSLDYDYPTYHSFFAPPVFFSFLLLSTLFGTAVYLLYKSQKAISAQLSALSYHNSPQPPLKLRGECPESFREGVTFITHDSRFTFYRLIAFGIFWFFIALSVESSVIPIVDVIFEHRVYLPSVGAFVALTAAAYAAAIKAAKRWPQTEKGIILLALIIVAVLSGAAFARNMVWRDRLTLWDDVVRKAPGNARAFNNRGSAFNDIGQFDRAIEDFNKAIALKPSYFLAYLNRGSAFGNKSRLDRAIEDFGKAIALEPSAVAYYLRGIIFELEGRTDKAIGDYEQAIALHPAYLEAYIRAGVLYGKSGAFDKAIDQFNRAVAINPNYSLAYVNRGFAYSLMGRYADALRDLDKAIELDRSPAGTYVSRGRVYLKMGDKEHAVSDFRKACDLGEQEGCKAWENAQLPTAIQGQTGKPR
jgi:tetratricopeptide (TPR) repeat protein